MTEADQSHKYLRLAQQCMRDAECQVSEEARVELLRRAQAYLMLSRGEVYVSGSDIQLKHDQKKGEAAFRPIVR